MSEPARLAATLHEGGVGTAFVVASVHNLDILSALAESGITIVGARSEMGAVYMADGCARVSGEPVVVLTSTGPGAGNAIGAFATAAKDGARIVHLTTSHQPNGSGSSNGLHTVPEEGAWLRAFGSPMIDLAVDTLADVEEVLRQGQLPATILIPVTGSSPHRSVEPPLVKGEDVLPSSVSVLESWWNADRPLLWIGGGARELSQRNLVALGEQRGAAVVTTFQGKDLFPSDHPLLAGTSWNSPIVRQVCGRADSCLALGTRFSELSTANWTSPFAPRVTLVGREVHRPKFSDLEELNWLETELTDAWLEANLLDRSGGKSKVTSSYGTEAAKEVTSLRAERPAALERDLVVQIASGLGDRSVVVCDMTKMSFWTAVGMATPESCRVLFPGLLTMGYGLGAAIGASVADPEAHVVLIVGDGGLTSSMADMDAIALAPVGRMTIMLFDDNGYGLLRRRGDTLPQQACSFDGPRWADLARAYGLEYEECDEVAGLGAAIARRVPAPRLLRYDASHIRGGWTHA